MNTPNFIFMQLIGNQTEWAKAYALLHIINEGNIYFYKDNFQNEYSFYPVSKLIRNDECGKITYQLTPTEVLVRRGEETQRAIQVSPATMYIFERTIIPVVAVAVAITSVMSSKRLCR